MAFVHLTLLAGGSLIAIPIILHLAMRQKPKRLVFPALQFIRQRRESNTRKLQLRHLLLLMLRCLAIAVPAIALARPSVAMAAAGAWLTTALSGLLLLVVLVLLAGAIAGRKSIWLTGGLGVLAMAVLVWTSLQAVAAARGATDVTIGDQEAPVAAVLVVDSAPRMQYRHENKTRLEQAQEIGKWLIRQLPPDSDIGVIDSQVSAAVFAADLTAARQSLERLEVSNTPRRLVEQIDEALGLAEQSDKSRKEIYIFTDLSQTAWDRQAAAPLSARLAELPEVQLYVIDVGVDEPVNFALGDVQLSSESVTGGGELRITTDISSIGAAGERNVELRLEDPDPKLPLIQDGEVKLPAAKRRSQQLCNLSPGAVQQVEFTVSGMELGVHHGWVAIVGEDGLPADDVRYFTLRAVEPWKLLVVAPEGVNTYLLTEALAPETQRLIGAARFECQVVDQPEFAEQSLEQYAAVCFVDPAPMAPAEWEKLTAYVRGGGGAALFLGPRADASGEFDSPAARALLGGELERVWRAGGSDLFLDPRRYEHPMLADFRPIATSVPWNRFPVFMHWGMNVLDADARVIVRYGNEQPAIVEKTLGQGRVVTMTTPITEVSRPQGREPWNELALGDDWPRLVLVNLMMLHLVEQQGAKLNYRTGETAVLPNQGERDPERYELFTPTGEPQELTARDGQIAVRFTDHPGAYRLKGFRDGPVVRGFSVNLAPSDTSLARAPRETLDQILGVDRYKLAKNRDEIERDVGESRVGREFYPYLVLFFVLVLGLEHLLSNRFYRREEE